MDYQKIRDLLHEYCDILWKIFQGRDYCEFERVEIHKKIIEELKLTDIIDIEKVNILLHNFPTRPDGYSWVYDITEVVELFEKIKEDSFNQK